MNNTDNYTSTIENINLHLVNLYSTDNLLTPGPFQCQRPNPLEQTQSGDSHVFFKVN